KSLAFNARFDPLPPSADPCEQTSKDAIFDAIGSLREALNVLHIVGARVDVVAHSMGGLAIRNYASQASYKSLQNRLQGDFHDIITLDTPELGSELAQFLVDHSACTRSQFLPPAFTQVWNSQCGLVQSTTVAQCFAAMNRPLSPLNYPI